MEIHQLRYFVATAELGSASRAAERCRVAQPSLSQQIKKLELELGVALFDRAGKGMVLTDAGRALLPRAGRILAEVREARSQLAQDVSRGGSLVVGAIPTIAPYVLPRGLQRLRAEWSGEIAVREDLTERLVEALVDHEIDCAILGTMAGHDLVVSEVLGEEELVVVAPRDGPRGGGGEERSGSRRAADAGVSTRELKSEPRIALVEEHCLGRQVEGFCSGRGIAPRIVCRTTQLQTMMELVALGLGIAVVPAMAARAAGERFVARRFTQNRPRRQIVVAWRRDRTRAEGASRLVRHIREALASAGCVGVSDA